MPDPNPGAASGARQLQYTGVENGDCSRHVPHDDRVGHGAVPATEYDTFRECRSKTVGAEASKGDLRETDRARHVHGDSVDYLAYLSPDVETTIRISK